MLGSQWESREFRYTAEAGRGEEVTLWAVAVAGRFVPLTLLPTRNARQREHHPYRGRNQVLASEEGEPNEFDGKRRPGQVWEMAVVLTALVGTRIRKRIVYTARPAYLNTWWDYVQAGEVSPIRRYRDSVFILSCGGRLLSPSRYREEVQRRKVGKAAAGELSQQQHLATARELLRALG
ncbi:MAG TPA: hypothetical protein ENK23_07735 [Sorangium sp.]|nr:hypothetical protein [Sorangium sp.]